MGAAPAGGLEATVSREWPGTHPLDRLPPGRAGRILSIAPREPEQLARLASFGFVPGAVVRLQQSRPATVLRLGETVLALDPAIAAGVHVERIEEDEP
jgi:Fe2+ transport system protein FeoA